MTLFEKIVTWALALITKFGYGGIFLTMSLESAAIPIPSEVVLPFSGFLASSGKLSFWIIIVVATLANLVGSIVVFCIGYFGGRPLITRYGKYLLIHQEEVEKIDSWARKNGARAAFISRLLPGVRTFSSLVLGATRINFKKFFAYTLLGSLTWNLPLVYVGLVTGKNWEVLHPYFQKFEMLIIAVLVIAVIVFILKHVRKLKTA